MKISKTISIVNQSLYVLIALSLIGFYLDVKELSLLLILGVYAIFLYRKSKKLLLIVLFLMGLYGTNYIIQYQKIHQEITSPTLICTITTIPDLKENYLQFYAKCGNNKILVREDDLDLVDSLKIGYQIKMDNQVELVKNNTVPNQFNYAKFLLAYNIAYQNNVDTVKIVSTHCIFYYYWINQLIHYYEHSKISDYLLSFIVGNKKAFSDDFTNDVQTLNITHLFVVSGFHVGFIYLFLKFIFKYLRISKEKSEIFITFLLIIFLVINNFALSVARAVIFIILLQVKKKYRLPVGNIHLLSLIACVNLIINPFLLNQTGFILSYLITLVLLLSHDLLKHSKNYFKSLFQINLLAQLFSLPIVANFNFSYNFLSFLLTPFLSIIYTFIIFPFIILTLIFKPIDKYVVVVFDLYEKCLSNLSTHLQFMFNIGSFNCYRYILYYLILYLIIKKIEIKRFSYLLSLFLLLITLFYHRFSVVDEVTFIDVGQGDSIFIRSDTNSCNALIDTGGSTYYHPGERVGDYFKSEQIRKLDVLFITHTDIDHAGDYFVILNQFKVDTIVFNAYDNSDLQKEIEISAKEKKINILKVLAYNRVECGKLTFNILNPLEKNNTTNDNSLVLFLLFNRENYLFMGDAQSQIFDSIMGDTIDFLKVSHHGGKNETTNDFLNAYQIKQAVISVGINNYNHPSDEVINLLDEHKITYYRTDMNGTISVKYYLKKKRIIKSYSPYNIITNRVWLVIKHLVFNVYIDISEKGHIFYK